MCQCQVLVFCIAHTVMLFNFLGIFFLYFFLVLLSVAVATLCVWQVGFCTSCFILKISSSCLFAPLALSQFCGGGFDAPVPRLSAFPRVCQFVCVPTFCQLVVVQM